MTVDVRLAVDVDVRRGGDAAPKYGVCGWRVEGRDERRDCEEAQKEFAHNLDPDRLMRISVLP